MSVRPTTDGLDLVRRCAASNKSLAVLITTRPGDTDPQVALVNAAVVRHPTTAALTVGLVARQGAKLRNLRLRPRATLVFHAGWEWVAVRGPVDLIGPDDRHPAVTDDLLTRLLRDIYLAAGGRHHDLSDYDRAMADERRCAVLIQPDRIWTNPPGAEHRESGDQK